jgi:hypothetical protein
VVTLAVCGNPCSMWLPLQCVVTLALHCNPCSMWYPLHCIVTLACCNSCSMWYPLHCIVTLACCNSCSNCSHPWPLQAPAATFVHCVIMWCNPLLTAMHCTLTWEQDTCTSQPTQVAVCCNDKLHSSTQGVAVRVVTAYSTQGVGNLKGYHNCYKGQEGARGYSMLLLQG